MGALTDYFLADQKQLAEIFKGWLTVDDNAITREIKNPFTGKTQLSTTWPTKAPISTGTASLHVDLSSISPLSLIRVDLVVVARLLNILTGMSLFETLDIVNKPALKHPFNGDIGLHEVPDSLTSSLRHLTDEQLKRLAIQWHETDEKKPDGFTLFECIDVLQSLRALAGTATPEQRMYLLWNI